MEKVLHYKTLDVGSIPTGEKFLELKIGPTLEPLRTNLEVDPDRVRMMYELGYRQADPKKEQRRTIYITHTTVAREDRAHPKKGFEHRKRERGPASKLAQELK